MASKSDLTSFLTPTVTMLPKYEETVKGSELPAWVSAAGKELYEQSRSLTGQGSPLYTGDRIASYDDISGETEMGFNMVNTADGYDPTTGNYYFNNQAFTDKSLFSIICFWCGLVGWYAGNGNGGNGCCPKQNDKKRTRSSGVTG